MMKNGLEQFILCELGVEYFGTAVCPKDRSNPQIEVVTIWTEVVTEGVNPVKVISVTVSDIRDDGVTAESSPTAEMTVTVFPVDVYEAPELTEPHTVYTSAASAFDAPLLSAIFNAS